MPRKTQKQLEDEIKAKNPDVQNIREVSNVDEKEDEARMSSPDIIGDIMQENRTTLRYQLPEQDSLDSNTPIPNLNPTEYPTINVRGTFPAERQKRGANLLLLREIEELITQIDIGNNRNATLNFLIWVGLQTLKGLPKKIDVRVGAHTYADGKKIE